MSKSTPISSLKKSDVCELVNEILNEIETSNEMLKG